MTTTMNINSLETLEIVSLISTIDCDLETGQIDPIKPAKIIETCASPHPAHWVSELPSTAKSAGQVVSLSVVQSVDWPADCP